MGRAQELVYVWGILDGSERADVVLSGAVGVGKSRLAREIARRARADGWGLEWIRATEATREITFGAVSRWIEPSTAGRMTSSERFWDSGCARAAGHTRACCWSSTTRTCWTAAPLV